DYALYFAKENDRGGVTVFDQQHEENVREMRAVDRRIQDADFMQEISLVFQPIVDPKGAATIGFEALARWHSPVLGIISPDVFIRSAERAGTINKLTAFLLEKALKEAKKWPSDLFISFNLSMQDITSSEAMLRLIAIVNRSGFDPKRITFEVTETSIMKDYDIALTSLSLLKNMGCKIALDDFGTGYSSLSYVSALPLDKLKLDRSFIIEIENSEEACSIVLTMVEMCQSLNLDCIVEGVETRGQVKILSAMGVQLIQGFYYSKPLRCADAIEYVMNARYSDEFSESPMAQSKLVALS
ncbi:MAG: EAL domain-containing protein, partial [Devosiaceae bacterium]|nr:EAL domain-containing protein [Devosiaceae bacterium]